MDINIHPQVDTGDYIPLAARPHIKKWLLPTQDYKMVEPRLKMCGNVVVPNQALTAMQILKITA